MQTNVKTVITSVSGDPAMPLPWTSLVQRPSIADHLRVAQLLKTVDSDDGAKRLQQLVRGDLANVASFLSAVPGMTFFMVIWDNRQFQVHQKAGPNKRNVMAMLRRRQPRKSRRRDGNDFDQAWEAVQIVLEELDQRENTSFAIAWQLDDDPIPEITLSDDLTRDRAWTSILQSLSADSRADVPKEPPPGRFELEKTLTEPAQPTEQLPNPKHLPSIPWHEYQKQNFDRDPAWRWNRAWSLAQNGCYFSHKRDDQFTGCAVRFLRGLLRQDETLLPFDEMPDMILAHDIWKEGGDRRLELEARLLSRQASPEIAERMEFSADAVDAYIDTFFDIRNRLDSRTYITKKVIGAQWAASLNPREGLLRSIAYFGGAGVLEAVLRYFHNHGQLLAELTSEETVQDPIATRLDLLLRAHSMPGDLKTALRMASIYPELLRDATASSAESYVGVLSRIVPPLPQDVVQSDVEHVETTEHVAA